MKGLVVDSNKGWQTIIGSMQHGWSRALKWKPWGLRMSALLGLGMFYFDKASDITLLKQVFWAYLDGLCFAGSVAESVCLARVYPDVSAYHKIHWLDCLDKALSVEFCVSNSAWDSFDNCT